MAREASLFDESAGTAVEAYLMLKSTGSANIPPMWIERARASRKSREARLSEVLHGGGVRDFPIFRDWELAYRKECFYRGIRVLLEPERDGESEL
jgi:hypothetical protein